MNHLVLSVGGARGSFQAGAIAALVRRGFTFDAVYGHSVGALNGAMVASGAIPELVHLWNGVRDKDVYRHKFGVARALWAAAQGKAMLDLDPLRTMIVDELCTRSLKVPFTTGKVSLETGVLSRSTHTPEDWNGLDQAVYDSSAIPFVFPLDKRKADGGIIDPIPLSPAIEAAQEDDLIIIVSCHPLGNLPPDGPRKPIGELVRTFEVMQHALVQKSISPFLRLNRMLPEGGLTDPKTGRTYKRFRSMVIAPKERLSWGMVDFDSAYQGIDRGYIAATSAVIE
jgi:NTE family protein